MPRAGGKYGIARRRHVDPPAVHKLRQSLLAPQPLPRVTITSYEMMRRLTCPACSKTKLAPPPPQQQQGAAPVADGTAAEAHAPGPWGRHHAAPGEAQGGGRGAGGASSRTAAKAVCWGPGVLGVVPLAGAYLASHHETLGLCMRCTLLFVHAWHLALTPCLLPPATPRPLHGRHGLGRGDRGREPQPAHNKQPRRRLPAHGGVLRRRVAGASCGAAVGHAQPVAAVRPVPPGGSKAEGKVEAAAA